ncbi:YebY family protein [Chitinophaga horti]|uniref:YebY family protein n=1 Tax=Chitinophaga horti TaxID=2920382 RepID=A0ABY6IXT4_9BACT|nr:YebY family protein [Chitinophaga horti]UYQ92198.1 YebY family protein [Chitinophaga horti]
MKKAVFPILAVITFAACSEDSQGVVFKKEDYGAKWPFSVEEIEVYCAGLAKSEIYFRSGEKTYALNGDARRMAETRKSAETFDDVSEVLLTDLRDPNSKMPVPDELIKKAFENCK